MTDIFDPLGIFFPTDLISMIESYTTDSEKFNIVVENGIKSALENAKTHLLDFSSVCVNGAIEQIWYRKEKCLTEEFGKLGTTKEISLVLYKQIENGISSENLSKFILRNISVYPRAEILVWRQQFGTGSYGDFSNTMRAISEYQLQYHHNYINLKCIIIKDSRSNGMFKLFHDKDRFKMQMKKVLSQIDQMCIILISTATSEPEILMASKTSNFREIKFRFWKLNKPSGLLIEYLR